MKKEFFFTGHITNDLEPSPHIGGAVTYAAVTVRKLDMEAHIVTKASAGHPYLSELSDKGLKVTRLPAVDKEKELSITSFQNLYDENGRRRQIVSTIQEKINRLDLPNFPKVPEGSIIFAAPVIREVDPEVFPKLASIGRLIVAPQGYFRQEAEGGEVKHRPWAEVDSLRQAELVILSDEDLTFDDSMDEAYLERIKALCPTVVLTKGVEGLTVFRQGEEPMPICALPMAAEEMTSPTGAGDACGAAFTWHYLKSGKLHEAGVFGALYSALKLMGLGGSPRGIEALPTLVQVRRFIDNNPKRFDAFLTTNGLRNLSL